MITIETQHDYDKYLSRLQFLTNLENVTEVEKQEMKELNQAIIDFDTKLIFLRYAKLN